MPSKIHWLKHVAFISIVIVVSWLWISLFSVSTRVYVLIAVVIVALYCVNAYLSSKLSFVWRLACFMVFSAIFLFIVFWPFERFLAVFVLDAIAVSLLSPTQLRSQMTIWEAWKYLRNSQTREKDAAKAIIAEHLRAASRQTTGL
ncbi:MAG TPA: hypothetical protein VJW20_16075 [Candidatus Angelobacter sp.]|nr:hypothetical protein [Candidatus Angelobacter sp.]